MDNLNDTFADLAAFSLANSFDESLGGATKGDYTFVIYLGVALLLIIVGMFIYKFYLNQKKVRFSDESGENKNTFFGGACPI
jgi:hypothetical protein